MPIETTAVQRTAEEALEPTCIDAHMHMRICLDNRMQRPTYLIRVQLQHIQTFLRDRLNVIIPLSSGYLDYHLA
jgi:hypothetical protein